MIATNDLRAPRYAPHARMAPHSHDTPSIGVIVEGGFRERIGRAEHDYRPGIVSFCPAGVAHSQSFGAEGARQIIFRPKDDWLAFLADEREPGAASLHARSPAGRELGLRLLAEMARGDALAALACEGLMLEIVAAFGRARSDTAMPAWLGRARDMIHARSDETLTVARIARAVGRHDVHVAREFRRHFGLPIGAYLRRLRAEEAAARLLRSRAGITEIALACGFASHAHLCRVFKARFGMTPSQYRALGA
ncbi:MAG: AraC family transcriptional regulator [Rhizomicrobium sp.]